MNSISLIWFICLIIFLKETCTGISLTGVDVASRYGVAKPLTAKKPIEVVFVLKAIYKKGGAFKYPKVLQIDNGSMFKSEVTKLFEKHSVKIRRATTKYKHTHTPFVEDFSKELEKLLFKPMDAQELQNPKKVSKIWVKNLDPSVKRLNNTVSSMIGMKPKDAIKLDCSTRQKMTLPLIPF